MKVQSCKGTTPNIVSFMSCFQAGIIILMIIIIFNAALAVGESQTSKLLKPEHVIGLPPGITLRVGRICKLCMKTF